MCYAFCGGCYLSLGVLHYLFKGRRKICLAAWTALSPQLTLFSSLPPYIILAKFEVSAFAQKGPWETKPSFHATFLVL